MAFQVPVHAAMMQTQAAAGQMDMAGMNCHCPPAVCDTVLASDNQSVEGIKIISSASLEFNSYFVSIINVDLAALLNLNFIHSDRLVRETSPPPILLNTTLLI
ncbi:MAG: hypothetical protein OQK76_00485 [Gammaproteobacteria bacterium]|nr:hypothetical protein [Gammaproteobacteria bacterium]MCW8909074.1 hypothetical protein [Gammaproteobacteria bacterium]MCW9003872.1 hypothetical protein [Gammaproteobacteria bacterium]MCW9055161.1 hypothetical protein [Gammaproteobacteria bacterium]